MTISIERVNALPMLFFFSCSLYSVVDKGKEHRGVARISQRYEMESSLVTIE